MSRCFPYPPPGCTLSRSSEDTLIESIKLQKERVKAKEQRKERIKEKKERRKEEDKRKERKEKQIQIRTQISMIFQRDNMTRIFGQVSIIWKKVASLMSVSSLFVCAFLALPRTAPKIAPKGRENPSPLIAGMAMAMLSEYRWPQKNKIIPIR
ncbi:uncharacterized protein [Primulina huaijiensis]|uniref:uncharacterized protein n=1 Tax=Primulina huaijiensis TaxID=1492673 RepID=UPI003CC6DEB7